MQIPELSKVWQSNLGDSEPVAHLLRDRFNDRWVRFHSLAESKRYPETEAEMAITLGRHNRLISRLAGEEENLTLLSTECSSSASPGKSELAEHAFGDGEKAWRSVAMHELSKDWEEPTYWNVFSTVIHWRPGVLDRALRLVAMDKAANVMVLSRHGWLYHPYDGGADVILPTREERTLLASEFHAWLSRHPLGL